MTKSFCTKSGSQSKGTAVPPKTPTPKLKHAKSTDFAACFEQLGLKKAKNKKMAIDYILERLSDEKVVAALRMAPRWADTLVLLPPPGLTWDRFGEFRYLLKAMACDFSAAACGSSPLKPRKTT